MFLIIIRSLIRSHMQALELERFSHTDHLTGLVNCNSFEKIFNEWSRNARAKAPFSLVFGDVNGLKRVNDTYGQTTGDQLIRAAATLLAKIVRSSDFVFRFGGDELVVLCPDTSRKEAEGLVERIRDMLADAALADSRMFQVKKSRYTEHGLERYRK